MAGGGCYFGLEPPEAAHLPSSGSEGLVRCPETGKRMADAVPSSWPQLPRLWNRQEPILPAQVLASKMLKTGLALPAPPEQRGYLCLGPGLLKGPGGWAAGPGKTRASRTLCLTASLETLEIRDSWLHVRLLCFVSFVPAHGMQKFCGQGLNSCCNSDPSYSSDSATSLSCCTTRELLACVHLCVCTLTPAPAHALFKEHFRGCENPWAFPS